jgi:hypothetical protein
MAGLRDALIEAGRALDPASWDRQPVHPLLDARRLLVWQPAWASAEPIEEGKPPPAAPPEAAAPLGLSDARNQHTRPERYGRNGLTPNGAKQIQRAAGLLQEGIGRLAFWTITLPPRTVELLLADDLWAEFQARIHWLLRRALTQHGLVPRIVGVAELHPRRSFREGIPIPHLHVLFEGSRERWRGWVLSRKDLDRIIGKAIEYVGLPAPDLRAAGNVQPVRRNVGAYLSKYMSKNRSRRWLGACGDRLPRVWWFWSGAIREEVRATTVRVCWAFVRWLTLLPDRERERLGWTIGRYETSDPNARATYWASCRSHVSICSTQTSFLSWTGPV